jgi:hypothetical protein
MAICIGSNKPNVYHNEKYSFGMGMTSELNKRNLDFAATRYPNFQQLRRSIYGQQVFIL